MKMNTAHPSVAARSTTITIELADWGVDQLAGTDASPTDRLANSPTDGLILNYWLVKSEPDTYGWHQFTQKGRAVWDGVRNYQARNNLNAMRMGDQVLFYHSVSNPSVVGLATVVREAYPDPTVFSEPGATIPIRWVAVDLEPVLALDKPVPLAAIKAESMLANIALVKHSRLSVMPIRPNEFELILRMGTEFNE